MQVLFRNLIRVTVGTVYASDRDAQVATPLEEWFWVHVDDRVFRDQWHR